MDALFAAIWGSAGQQVAMPVNLLRALIHSGNYVSGAWRDGELVGAAVAFLGRRDGVSELHSHVAGVARSEQGSGVGYAIKLHQRAWAGRRGLARVVWTYDPLVRRNGWFNVVKLGARAVAYYPNLYGVMEDELNGTDETDRCLVSWDVGPGGPPGATGETGPAPARAPARMLRDRRNGGAGRPRRRRARPARGSRRSVPGSRRHSRCPPLRSGHGAGVEVGPPGVDGPGHGRGLRGDRHDCRRQLSARARAVMRPS